MTNVDLWLLVVEELNQREQRVVVRFVRDLAAHYKVTVPPPKPAPVYPHNFLPGTK